MYRFLLTPRWWVINVFVALAIPVCLVAGTWQLGRFEDRVETPVAGPGPWRGCCRSPRRRSASGRG